MSVAERLAQRYLFLDWLSTSMSESLPQAGWAMDGDAALLAHGVPAAPDRFQIAIVDDPEVIAACDRLRESPTNDYEFRLVSELPPTAMVVPAGEHLVPILPLDAIERGPEGSPERLEREAAIAAYLEHLSG